MMVSWDTRLPGKTIKDLWVDVDALILMEGARLKHSFFLNCINNSAKDPMLLYYG